MLSSFPLENTCFSRDGPTDQPTDMTSWGPSGFGLGQVVIEPAEIQLDEISTLA